jgi:hypothetical protein
VEGGGGLTAFRAPAFQFSARTPVALPAVGLPPVVGTAVAGGFVAPALQLSVLAALVRVAGRALVLEYAVGAGFADHAAVLPPIMRARLSLPLARHGSRSRRRSARWLARRRLRSSRLDGLFQKKTKKNSDPTKRRMKSHDSSSRERELVAARGAVADAARAEEDERRPARVMGGRKRCSHGKL